MTLPRDPTVAEISRFIVACWHDGLPTCRSYVGRRLREAGLDVDDATITRACSSAPVPYRPEPR